MTVRATPRRLGVATAADRAGEPVLYSPAVMAVIFAAAAAVVLLARLLLPGGSLANESSDYVSFYEPVARSILAGRGPLTQEGNLAVRWPPGYPILLAAVLGLAQAIGLSEGAALVGMICASMGLAAVVLYRLALSVWPFRGALLVPAVFATYPPMIWFTKQPNSEVPFLPVFYGSVALAWAATGSARRPRVAAFGAGLLAGFGMLMRPAAIGLGLILAVFLWVRSRTASRAHRFDLAALVLLGNLLAVLPWQAWVYSKTGRVVPLSTAGVSALRNGLIIAGDRKSSVPIRVHPDVAALTRRIDSRYEELQTVGDVVRLLASEFRRSPGAVTRLLVLKVGRSWYATDSRRYERPILVVQLFYLTLIAWAAWRSWTQGGAARSLAALALAITMYTWFLTAAMLPIVRYMVPPIGLMFALVPAILRRPRVEASGPALGPEAV